jgi:hypothetical protein
MDVAAMVSVGRSAADFPFDRLRLTDRNGTGRVEASRSLDSLLEAVT